MNRKAMAKALGTEAAILLTILAIVWGVNNGLQEYLIKLGVVAMSINVFLLITYAIYMIYEIEGGIND